jgi:hypothetical protein
MGTQNWSTTWLTAAAIAVAHDLALATGAWPIRFSPPENARFTPVWTLEA